MSENKTRPEVASVADFLASIADEKRRGDAHELSALMGDVTGERAVMWGTGIVGFGSLHYKYESGREGDTPVVSFAPRKNALVLYGIAAHDEAGELLAQLGQHDTGKGCIYIGDLSRVDTDILRRMIARAFAEKSPATG